MYWVKNDDCEIWSKIKVQQVYSLHKNLCGFFVNEKFYVNALFSLYLYVAQFIIRKHENISACCSSLLCVKVHEAIYVVASYYKQKSRQPLVEVTIFLFKNLSSIPSS